MLILAIEASTPVSSVALLGEEGLVAEYTLSLQSTQSERLLPAIDTILKDTERTGEDVSAVAVSVGPGSFTGVRVAVSTAKGIARAWEKPVIAVSSLLGLANRFPEVSLPIFALLDARKNEVYAASFHNEQGILKVDTPERAIRPEVLCREIRKPALFVGEGALRYRSLLRECLPSYAVFTEGSLNNPSAASIAEIGLSKFRRGRVLSPEAVVPNYIRRSEAEIYWKEKSIQRPLRGKT
jgi:tRNA threonylcarbamoyladenosine biosynthesis protein TsaB